MVKPKRSGAAPRGAWPEIVIVVLGVVALWAGFLSQQEALLVSQAASQLAAVAQAKAEQVATWRAERLSDAHAISAHPLLPRVVRQLESGREPARARADLAGWCRSRLLRTEVVRVAVFGPDGAGLAAEGAGDDGSSLTEAARVLRTGAVELSRLHRDGSGAVHVDLFAPLHLEEAGERRLAGLVVLRLSPQRVLSPVELRAPLGAASAATWVLDRSGGETLAMGGEGAGGTTRRVLGRSGEGTEGGAVFEVTDASGVPLLAADHPVPGSSWSVVVLADRGGALSPLRTTALRSLPIVAVVIAVLVASRLYWSRRRAREHLTRQAAMEGERQDLQRRYDALCEGSTDAVLVADDDCRILQANDRAAVLYGVPAASLIGRSIQDLFGPGSAGEHDLRRLQVDVEGAVKFETSHRRADGSEFPVDVLAHAVEAGGRRVYQSVVRDLTDRKRAEATLRASEEKFRAAFFDAPVGTALVDASGRFLEFNAALCRMLGRGADELQRLRFSDLLHPDDRAASVAAFGSLLAGERDHNDMERRYLRGNGEVVHTRYSVSAIRDGTGRFQYAMAVIQDATAQVLSEAALRASEERFRLALEATEDGIWDWHVPSNTLHISEPWLARLGYRPDQIENMQDTLVAVHPENRRAFLELVEANLEGRASSFELEHRVLTGDGSWRWVVTRGKVVARNADGSPLRAVGSQTDVTERKRLEGSLHMAERMATVGTLAAGVVHEINNPLTYVRANLEFVEAALGRHVQVGEAGKAPATELGEARRALGEAQEGVDRIAKIAQDLKTFSRTDDAWSRLDLPFLMESSIRFAASALSARARVVRDFHDAPAVMGAAGRLSQVFLNLLLNAAQAIPEGKPAENQVTVRIRPAPDRQVRIEIADTGCGIPAEQRTRIFDAFFTTKPAGVGTGLGLSICQEFVATHGGRIEVESELGKGSTFTVILPAEGDERRHGPAHPGEARPGVGLQAASP